MWFESSERKEEEKFEEVIFLVCFSIFYFIINNIKINISFNH